MVIFGTAVAVVLFILWVYAVLDVIATDSFLCRALPKSMWLFVVLFFPAVGSGLWLLFGRPINTTFNPGGGRYRTERETRQSPLPPAPLGIEDRPDWPSQAKRLLNQEQDDSGNTES